MAVSLRAEKYKIAGLADVHFEPKFKERYILTFKNIQTLDGICGVLRSLSLSSKSILDINILNLAKSYIDSHCNSFFQFCL